MKPAIPNAASNLTFNEVYHFFLENLWIILIFLTFFLTAADIYLYTATPMYDAIATVEVLQRQHPVVDMGKDEPDDYRSLDELETVEGNLQRTSLLLQVLQRPEIKANPYLAKLAADPESIDNAKALTNLGYAITAKLRRGTRLVDVTVEHMDPETAQLVANILVDEYINEGYRNQSGSYQNTNQFLTQESQRMRDKLQGTETELQDYAKLVDLRQRIVDERKQLDLLQERYLEKHPKIIQANALLADLKKQFLDEMDRRKVLEQQQGIKPTGVPETNDMSNLTEDQKVEREMVEEESRYTVLSQEEATERTMYESVLDRLKEAGISQGYQDANVRLVQPALLPNPNKPAKPIGLLVLAIGVFLGGASGVGLALALSSMDSSFKTVDDAESHLKLPSLGAIPQLRTRSGGDLIFAELPVKKNSGQAVSRQSAAPQEAPANGTINPALLMEGDPSQIVAEAIRTLRATLKLLGRRDDRKTFLFASAVPAEGKSFVASNLAVAMAQEGNRVLLIDADLRKPTIHQIFGLSRNEGLGEWLAGVRPISELVVPSGVENLSLMLAGGHAPNPAELLSNGTFPDLLRQALLEFDYVLVDSAPIHAVGDTMLICEYFQTTCVVVHAGKTPAAAVARAIRLLTHAGAKIPGFVLNRLPHRTGFGSNPYYYYYQSTDKYGQAYGAKKR